MSYIFKSEDFYDALRSIEALGSFPSDLSDYRIRNSDKYKQGCKHLHLDMLKQELLVVDMDSLPTYTDVHPFRLPHDGMLIALQSNMPNMKRMLAVSKYENEGEEEMIIVPLIAAQQKHQWNPAGLVVFLRDLDAKSDMRIHHQEFPGASVHKKRCEDLTGVILDAMNMIVGTIGSGMAHLVHKEPSKLKIARATERDASIELRSFTKMTYKGTK